MSLSKKIDLSEAQNPIPPPSPLSWIQYTYSHTEGGWRGERLGGEVNQREG
jgi:hypothetical protein